MTSDDADPRRAEILAKAKATLERLNRAELVEALAKQPRECEQEFDLDEYLKQFPRPIWGGR